MEKPWLAHYEPAVPHRISYPQVTLYQTLADSVQKFPNQPAMTLVLRYLGPLRLGGRLSYRQLQAEVDRFAAALHSLGVRKGDRIAVVLPNLPQFVIAFYGAMQLGAIVVNTNPLYTAVELQHQLHDSGAETVVLLSGFYDKLKQIQAQTAVKHVIVTEVSEYVTAPLDMLVKRTLRQSNLMAQVPGTAGVYHWRALLKAHPEQPPRGDVRPGDIALLQFTGGTTGVPKAAMLTHANLVADIVQGKHWIVGMADGQERVMGAIPFFHVYGMTTTMLLSVYAGGDLIIIPNPRPIDGVMQAIARERATIFPGVPALYMGINNHPKVATYDLRSIKACLSGAASLPMDVQLRFEEITGGRLVEGYGLTEAAPVTHGNPIYGRRKAGSIGIPFPDVEARIVDIETHEEMLVGEQGELWVRGPQVMAGYWNRPDETAQTLLPDGWLRTGDIAVMDEDGYFFIKDRLKDIIIASGFNVLPHEVEGVILEHPGVLEAIVVGIPDKYRGETVKAYLVMKPDSTATVEEIRAFCRERLAPYKVPTQVEFRSELPKSMVGKFLRRVLVEEEQQKLEAQG